MRALFGIGLILFAAQAFAGDVSVTEASVRATAPGQETAAVAMHIKSARDAKLVAASSPAAKRVEIHIMKHANGMMEMRAVDSLALPANQDVALGSGSHLMLVGIKHPLKPGERVRLTLTIEFANKHKERVKVVAPVQAIGGHDMGNQGMEGHHMDGQGMDGRGMGDHMNGTGMGGHKH